MIISLSEAQAINPKLTQADLDGLEALIRRLAFNNFHNIHARVNAVSFIGNSIMFRGALEGITENDTIEISHSRFNDGLYQVVEVKDGEIVLDRALRSETVKWGGRQAIATLVSYPADIVRGFRSLLEYDVRMAGKTGIASEKISRWSVTYNVNGESVGGYPKELMQFITPHRRLRW